VCVCVRLIIVMKQIDSVPTVLELNDYMIAGKAPQFNASPLNKTGAENVIYEHQNQNTKTSSTRTKENTKRYKKYTCVRVCLRDKQDSICTHTQRGVRMR